MGKEVRKLGRKADGSNPGSPDKHKAKKEDDQPGWVKELLKKMDNVETKMDGVTKNVENAVQAAKEAKEGLQQVETKIVTLQTEVATSKALVETEKKNRETWQAGMEERFSAIEFAEPAEDAKPSDPEMAEKLKDIEKKLAGMSIPDPWATWNEKGGHDQPVQAADTKDKDGEKRSRTVTFGPFPEDTKTSLIENFINDKMTDVKSDIEEIFAFGKTRAEKGGARFKTSDAMWKYMKTNAGNHKHAFKDTSIYANVDLNMRESKKDQAKVKAMRKVVRIVIEKNGGDAKEVKKNMETKYGKGRVWWNEERIAAWDEEKGQMILEGWAEQHEQEFIQLMKPKTVE